MGFGWRRAAVSQQEQVTAFGIVELEGIENERGDETAFLVGFKKGIEVILAPKLPPAITP